MKFPKLLRTSILSGVFMGAFLSLPPAEARLAPSDGIGGAGGAPFKLDCGGSALLVGVAGKSGAFIDQVAGLCVKIDPVSGNWVGGVYETARVGGNGGAPFSKVCPVGEALVGIEGTTDRFSGTLVVASLKIECTTLKIRTEYKPAMIKGIRRIGIYGDPDSTNIAAQQDLCYQPLKGTGRAQDQWVSVGIAFEGRAGLYLDHLHILCGELPQDPRGYRVDFRTNAQAAVPEGTPLQISWRAQGAAPELTPTLRYSWELHDWTHTRSGFLGPQPTPIPNPCFHATQPCESGWLSSASGSQVTFHSLPPARYELRVTVSTTAQTYTQSLATHNFEIRENLLEGVTLTPETIRSGGASTVTITLEGPAPPNGKKVYLTSSNIQLVPVPDSLTIPGGAQSTSLRIKADPNMLGGQAAIRVSTLKPLTIMGSKNSQISILRRGIPEMEEMPVTEGQKTLEGTDNPPAATETGTTLPPNETQQEGTPEPDPLAQEGNIPQGQEITERGISSFGKSGASQLGTKSLLSKPNQSTINTFPDVAKTPAPSPGVPIPYPNTAVSALQPHSTFSDAVKKQSSLITLPSQSKEALLTVQNSIAEQRPLAVPNVPPLQK